MPSGKRGVLMVLACHQWFSSLTDPHSDRAAVFIWFLQTDLGDPEGFEPSWSALEEHCLIR